MRRTIRRLTFVSDAPHFGGAERYIVAMAHAARRRGIEPRVHWLPVPTGDADVFAAARQQGIRVTHHDTGRPRGVVSLIRGFRAMVLRDRPDALVINASGRPCHWLLPWLAWRAERPAVWVHQMVDARDHRRLRPKWFDGRMEGLQCWRVPQMVRHRLAATAATAVVVLNAEDRERIIRWQGVPRDKIRVIPHGVDCEQFHFDPRGRLRYRQAWGIGEGNGNPPLVVGAAGRLSGEKGMDLLIEAAARLVAAKVPVRIVIAGQGRERDALMDLAARRGVAEVVRLLDFVEDMSAYYSAVDVFVLCSRTESFGLALAEAMACERTVIGTPTAGAMRQIDHRHTGWQLKTFSPVELADALAAIYRDPHGRERMGMAARESVIREFSIDLTLERTLRALHGSAHRRSRLPWPGMDALPYAAMAAEDSA